MGEIRDKKSRDFCAAPSYMSARFPMKVLVELLVIVILVAAGWNQSYRLHLERLFGADSSASGRSIRAPQTAAPYWSAPAAFRSSPAPDNSWLWQRTILDPKAH
jgi:hypothetical protein